MRGRLNEQEVARLREWVIANDLTSTDIAAVSGINEYDVNWMIGGEKYIYGATACAIIGAGVKIKSWRKAAQAAADARADEAESALEMADK